MLLITAGLAQAQTGGLPTQVGTGVSRVGSGVQPVQGSQQYAPPQNQAQGAGQMGQPQGPGQAIPSQLTPYQVAPQQNVPRPVGQINLQPPMAAAQAGRAQGPGQLPGQPPMPSPLMPPNLVNEVIESATPLSADELRTLRKELEVRKAAMTENISGRAPPRPTTSIYNLDLSPGSTPPVVRIEVGHGSIISFLDAAGRPWPAKVADNFSPTGLTLSQFTEHQLSIGTISSTPINAGVAVALEGIPVAITFSVISGQSMVDAQVHMVLPQYKGGTPPGVGTLRGEPSITAGDLMSYLLRTPPPTARKLTVEGLSGALAWQVSNDRMVLRTTAMVTTGSFRVQGIGDGTFAYEMPLSPQVRVVQGDRFESIRIGGFVTGGR
jgi:intracellular multiplication protein IcmK